MSDSTDESEPTRTCSLTRVCILLVVGANLLLGSLYLTGTLQPGGGRSHQLEPLWKQPPDNATRVLF
ncbi:MAG: hypothetical protein ABEL76_11225, partial [Bradymonadaceae bacterium]